MKTHAANVKRQTTSNLARAVHKNAPLSPEGLRERLFTFAFRGLVYPQIWEDPAIDMEALELRPQDHVVAIASGGCNVMSYLSANPGKVTAVDLNGAHVALNRLKLAAVRHLPDHRTFRRFFADADARANVDAYFKHVAPHLDEASRRYWEARDLSGRRRISHFTRGFYRSGLLGGFIGGAHLLARAHGLNPREILHAGSIEEQKRLFEERFAPLFEKGFIRWLVGRPASLYGLGIPPAQYRALAGDHPDGIVPVLRARLEKLACGFDLKDNYFAWQAFGRGYASEQSAPLPPYLQEEHFATVRAGAERVDVRHESLTEFLRRSAAASVDCVVLLDAQDWMKDEDLTDLWTQITRTARPGARVIFRTAADELLLPGRIPDVLLSQWRRDEARCADLHSRDRSAIYGAFHLYRFEGA